GCTDIRPPTSVGLRCLLSVAAGGRAYGRDTTAVGEREGCHICIEFTALRQNAAATRPFAVKHGWFRR
ncbi:MAG: hypothetical protein WA869_23495, partial [Alloacidobacterium sp.]